MRHSRSHLPAARPGWWPHDAPWPPPSPYMGAPFFRRMGCLFGFLLFSLSCLLMLASGWLAHSLGFLEFPAHRPGPGLLPLGLFVLLIFLSFFFLLGRGLRRLSIPLDELLSASHRIAEDDYTVRVAESGPAEVRHLAHAFNQMAARLQTNAEQRRNMLADVTHELRTPLTILQGGIEGILDGVYQPDEDHLKSLLEETQLISRLVDDLRTLALAESGALQLRKEATDLAILLADVTAAFQPQAAAAGVDLQSETPQQPPLLEVDPVRMREVLANLIANALRYTPAGGSILLRLEFSPAAADQPVCAKLTVQDTGPGIAPAELEQIFTRFYKARDSGGMGLGLAIARYLVEAHGGTITAHSASGEGTRMEICLPLSL